MTVDLTWFETNALETKLTAGEKKALSPLQEVTYNKGDSIISMGDEGGTLYIIKSGEAAVQDYNRYEGRLSFATLKEGDLIGELSFLNDRRAAADVKAETDCVVYKLRKEDMLKLTAEQPKLAMRIMNTIVNHEAKMMLHMRRELVPMLRKFKDQASGIPTTMKVVPIVFTIIYTIAFFMIGYKY